MTLQEAYVSNAVRLLERSGDPRVHRLLSDYRVTAAVEDWLSNGFVKTALTILKTFVGNNKIREAIRLLEEAGKEHEAEKKKKKSGRR